MIITIREAVSVANVLHLSAINGIGFLIVTATALAGTFMSSSICVIHTWPDTVRNGAWITICIFAVISLCIGMALLFTPRLWLVGFSVLIILAVADGWERIL